MCGSLRSGSSAVGLKFKQDFLVTLFVLITLFYFNESLQKNLVQVMEMYTWLLICII